MPRAALTQEAQCRLCRQATAIPAPSGRAPKYAEEVSADEEDSATGSEAEGRQQRPTANRAAEADEDGAAERDPKQEQKAGAEGQEKSIVYVRHGRYFAVGGRKAALGSKFRSFSQGEGILEIFGIGILRCSTDSTGRLDSNGKTLERKPMPKGSG